jgi:hypothetical protein
VGRIPHTTVLRGLGCNRTELHPNLAGVSGHPR